MPVWHMYLSYNIYDVRRCYLFIVWTEQMRTSYIEHAASGLPNHTCLEGEVRFVHAQDQQVLLDVVRDSNWVFTHSLDAD